MIGQKYVLSDTAPCFLPESTFGDLSSLLGGPTTIVAALSTEGCYRMQLKSFLVALPHHRSSQHSNPNSRQGFSLALKIYYFFVRRSKKKEATRLKKEERQKKRDEKSKVCSFLELHVLCV